MSRAKVIKTMPTSMSEIYHHNGRRISLSDYSAAVQRKLLVQLNREANRRLSNIAGEINKNKLSTSVLEQNIEFKRVGVKGKKYNVNNRFTLSRNLPKKAMEMQIRERMAFLESPMTLVRPTTNKFFIDEEQGIGKKTIKDVYGKQNAKLLEMFNEAMGTDYKRLTKDQASQFGRILNMARQNGLIHKGDTQYLKDYEVSADTLTIYKQAKELGLATEKDIENVKNDLKTIRNSKDTISGRLDRLEMSLQTDINTEILREKVRRGYLENSMSDGWY